MTRDLLLRKLHNFIFNLHFGKSVTRMFYCVMKPVIEKKLHDFILKFEKSVMSMFFWDT